MSRVRVLLLSHEKKDPFLEAAEDYLKRADRRYGASLVRLRPAKRGQTREDGKVRQEEAQLLLEASEGQTRVALDATGVQHTTRSFAHELEDLLARGRGLAFLIGGATGLDPRVRQEVQATWSLSPLTFPHRLAALVLAEQIYRAGEIARGGPYAK